MKTKLFEILSKVGYVQEYWNTEFAVKRSPQMPKGALLHAHLDATVNAEFLLKLALKHPALHVRVPTRLTVSGLASTLPEFRALPREQFSDIPSVTDASYEPGAWVSLQNARKSFDSNLGGPGGFDRWVIDSMTINPTEAYNTHNTITKVTKSSTRYHFLFAQNMADMGEIHEHFYSVNSKISDSILHYF